jgi:1-acyl-sn-glycerol-3-phosphate acyltransferase
MTVIGAGARLAVLALALILITPLEFLAVRLGLRIAGRLPLYRFRVLLWCLRVRVREHGAPPAAGPTLVLSNHISWLDIPILASLRPLSFIAKSEVAAWPVLGLYARLQGCIFIDRARKTHTTEVNRKVARRLARGDMIVLFPEGTTGDGNRLLPFRSALVGAARAALAEPSLPRIHLQPVAITYVRRNGLPITRRERPAIAWYGAMELAPHLAAFLREGSMDALVRWGEPILFDADSDRKQATAAAEAAVRRAIQETVRDGVAQAPPSAPALPLFSRRARAPKETADLNP